MKLYIIEGCYNPTSAATNRLMAFGKELVKKGVEVHFFYLFPYSNREKSNRDTDLFKFHYLWENNRFNNKLLNTYLSIRKLRKLMNPDIPLYVYSSLNVLYFLIKRDVKVYHEYTENPECVGKINSLLGRPLYHLYKKAVKKVEGLFVITPSLKAYYINEFGIDSEKVEVLNMIVDTHRFDDLKEVPIQNKISYCGILSEWKDGVTYLIQAFAQVKKKYPLIKLYMIGRFENEDVKCRIYKLISDLRLEESVVLTGLVQPHEMPRLLRESKVLALARPKPDVEAFGFATKIGEYLMSERPVVMTDVGNVTDYLQDGKNVLLARPNDVNEFANRLLWTLDHYDEAIEIGVNGKKAALLYFNAEIEVKKIYNRIFPSNLDER